MELKKKTIIWEDNTEPPKNYIWIKSDGKAYEFDYNDRKWKESQIVSSINSGSGGGDSAYNELISKEWMRVRIEDIDTYKKLISGEGGGGITPTRGPSSIKLKVDYENIPEGSTKVAICLGEDLVYAFGLTDMEASAYKYNNLYLIPDDIPINVALAIKKSQKEVEEGGETYTEDVYELTSGVGINLNTCLDFSDNSVIYVGAWEAQPQSQFDAGSYIWDQLTEDKIISGEELERLGVANMSPTDSAVTHAILDKAENVYKLGGVYIAVIPESTFVPVKTLVPLEISWTQ